jgi:hypothetical protein
MEGTISRKRLMNHKTRKGQQPQNIPESGSEPLRFDYTGFPKCWCGNKKPRTDKVCDECERIRAELIRSGILLRKEALEEYNRSG